MGLEAKTYNNSEATSNKLVVNGLMPPLGFMSAAVMSLPRKSC